MTLELDNLQAIVNRSATLADAAVSSEPDSQRWSYTTGRPPTQGIELGPFPRHDLHDATRPVSTDMVDLNNVGRVRGPSPRTPF